MCFPAYKWATLCRRKMKLFNLLPAQLTVHDMYGQLSFLAFIFSCYSRVKFKLFCFFSTDHIANLFQFSSLSTVSLITSSTLTSASSSGCQFTVAPYLLSRFHVFLAILLSICVLVIVSNNLIKIHLSISYPFRSLYVLISMFILLHEDNQSKPEPGSHVSPLKMCSLNSFPPIMKCLDIFTTAQ